MKLGRISLRTSMVLIAIIAVILGITAGWNRRGIPRDLQPGDGPLLIAAHTFQGPKSESYARELASELHDELKLRAYVHRYAPSKAQPTETWSVLVGDFPTKTEAAQALKRVKRFDSKTMKSIRWPVRPKTLNRSMLARNPLPPK